METSNEIERPGFDQLVPPVATSLNLRYGIPLTLLDVLFTYWLIFIKYVYWFNKNFIFLIKILEYNFISWIIGTIYVSRICICVL